MDIGMLWYDDDKRTTLEQKVNRSAAYYRQKYNRPVTACYVHPGLLMPDGATRHIGGIQVRPSRTVHKDHFWLGVDDAHPGPATEPAPVGRE